MSRDLTQSGDEDCAVLKISQNWLTRFLKRHSMVLRRKTNNHKLSMRERVPYILRCLWKIRRIQKSAPVQGEVGGGLYGRFGLQHIYNLDQVPLEDENKDGECVYTWVLGV